MRRPPPVLSGLDDRSWAALLLVMGGLTLIGGVSLIIIGATVEGVSTLTLPVVSVLTAYVLHDRFPTPTWLRRLCILANGGFLACSAFVLVLSFAPLVRREPQALHPWWLAALTMSVAIQGCFVLVVYSSVTRMLRLGTDDTPPGDSPAADPPADLDPPDPVARGAGRSERPHPRFGPR